MEPHKKRGAHLEAHSSKPPRFPQSNTRCQSRWRLAMEYHLATFFAALFEPVFWFWEQRRTRLLDLIDNERGGGQ